jgi:hypothetical protein
MSHFNSTQFYLDMDAVRHGWGISWQQAARESLVSISTIERIRDGGGFHVESLMLLAEFFELWDLKRYAMRKGDDERAADRSETV